MLLNADIISVMRSIFTQTHQVEKLKTKSIIFILIKNLFKPISLERGLEPSFSKLKRETLNQAISWKTGLVKPILYKQTYFIFIVTIMLCNLSDLVFYSNKIFVYLFGYCSGGGKALCWDFASFSFSLLQDTS